MKACLAILLLVAVAAEAKLNDDGCGRTKYIGGRIIGGTDAPLGRYPWQISLQYNLRHTCGGTILDDQWIMTAAHCVHGREDASKFTVLVGALDKSVEESHAVRHQVATIFKHERYNPLYINNDITLLKLETPIDFSNDMVNRVCVPTEVDYIADNREALISGWGDTNGTAGQNIPNVMQHAEIMIHDEEFCMKRWPSPLYKHETKLCALAETTATCVGDSGGPITVKDLTADLEEITVQVGVTSFGSSTGCLSRFPVVFARVSTYVPWMEEKMASN